MSSSPASISATDLWSHAPREHGWQRFVQSAPVRIVLGWLFVTPALGALLLASAFRLPSAVSVPVVVLLGLFAVWLLSRLEGRRALELSPSDAVGEWLGGLVLGGALFGASIGLLVVLHAYEVHTGGQWQAILTGLVLYVPDGLLEEILFRVVLFKIAEEALGSRLAIAITSVLFGLVHLANPDANAIGAGAIVIEAGVLLAAAYMLTRRLWLVWGLHTAWNLTQGSVFGVAVSGNASHASWLQSQPLGNPLMSGGTFGVEASPVAVGVCLAAALLFLRDAGRRGQTVTFREARERVRGLGRRDPERVEDTGPVLR